MEIILTVDGKTIALNDFVKDFLGGTIQGAIAPLKGIPGTWKTLEIALKR
jgi:hypothetical protein